MGNRRFHSQAFDDGTLLKLEIFRGYIREWLPVFLSKKSYPEVHIYDFFAGPGTDAKGNPGSPLLIIDELEQYLTSDKAPLAPDVRVFLHFNDADCDKMVQLEAMIAQRTTALPYAVKFTCMEFRLAFFESLQSIQNKDTANLVIMDQCGIKEVHRDIFATLVGCCATDILFFVSSSFIRRFITDESVQQHFNIPEDEMCAVSAKDIHRYVCREFYQKLIPADHLYHVAPFSIEKDRGANIYGIIFGSGSLFGLEKFLRVCWNKDGLLAKPTTTSMMTSFGTGRWRCSLRTASSRSRTDFRGISRSSLGSASQTTGTFISSSSKTDSCLPMLGRFCGVCRQVATCPWWK